MEQAVEMNQMQPQQPELPALNPVTKDLPKPLNDEMVRNAVIAAEQAGSDVVDLTQTTQTPAAPAPAVPDAPKVVVPEKFQKSDGTVDVDKLKASTKQLDEAIQQKEKTIEDYVAEYREKEKQFRNLPSNPDVIRQRYVEQPAAQQAPAVPQTAPQEDLNAIRARLAQDLQANPVDTIVDLIHAINEKQMEPLLKDHEARQQAERDEAVRRNLAEIAKEDRRVLQPHVFEAVNQELNSDRAYWGLKNPHKAAWLAVKERLHLGDQTPPAQPSRTASPILGGGTPPPVPSASGPASARQLLNAIGKAQNAEERLALEEQIRALLARMD